MTDFFKSVERLANLKGIAALLLLLVVLFFVWRNLDFITQVTFTLDREQSSPESSLSPRDSERAALPAPEEGVLSPQVTHLALSPVAFGLPAYFLVGIHNSGLDPGYVDVTVDFGPALVRAFEARPRDSFDLVAGDTGTSSIKGRFRSVDPDETVYVYALLSQPAF